MSTGMHLCIYIYIYLHTYMYIYIYVCIYTYGWGTQSESPAVRLVEYEACCSGCFTRPKNQGRGIPPKITKIMLRCVEMSDIADWIRNMEDNIGNSGGLCSTQPPCRHESFWCTRDDRQLSAMG